MHMTTAPASAKPLSMSSNNFWASLLPRRNSHCSEHVGLYFEGSSSLWMWVQVMELRIPPRVLWKPLPQHHSSFQGDLMPNSSCMFSPSSSPAGFSLHLPFSSLTFHDTITSPMPFIITLSPILPLAPCLAPFCLYSVWSTGRCLFSLWVPFLHSDALDFSFWCSSVPLSQERDSTGKVFLFERTRDSLLSECCDFRTEAFKCTYCVESGVHLLHCMLLPCLLSWQFEQGKISIYARCVIPYVLCLV